MSDYRDGPWRRGQCHQGHGRESLRGSGPWAWGCSPAWLWPAPAPLLAFPRPFVLPARAGLGWAGLMKQEVDCALIPPETFHLSQRLKGGVTVPLESSLLPLPSLPTTQAVALCGGFEEQGESPVTWVGPCQACCNGEAPFFPGAPRGRDQLFLTCWVSVGFLAFSPGPVLCRRGCSGPGVAGGARVAVPGAGPEHLWLSMEPFELEHRTPMSQAKEARAGKAALWPR